MGFGNKKRAVATSQERPQPPGIVPMVSAQQMQAHMMKGQVSDTISQQQQQQPNPRALKWNETTPPQIQHQQINGVRQCRLARHQDKRTDREQKGKQPLPKVPVIPKDYAMYPPGSKSYFNTSSEKLYDSRPTNQDISKCTCDQCAAIHRDKKNNQI